MREIHDFLFEEATEGMTAEEVLNFYRNVYHTEPQSTEHGIVANALNDILPRMILPPCKVGDIIYALTYDRKDYMPLKVTSRESLVRWMDEDQFGHALFTTREEAEQALKGERCMMNHDATHCADYTTKCPKSCYRAQLTEELNRIHYGLPISWSNFKGTKECPKTKGEHHG